MIIRELFNKLQKANPHQFEDDMLLMWLAEIEADINEYMSTDYSDTEKDDFEGLTVADDTQLEEPSIYIEFLSHKIDFANGEYERANNHAAMYNALLMQWRERWFREHVKKIDSKPDYIGGLL